MADLTAGREAQAVGEMIRRLNSIQPRFRSLITKTIAALDQQAPAGHSLHEIDPRWSQLPYWQAIAATASPWTDRNILAALDLRREGGSIRSMSQAESANRAIFARTFAISGLVTLSCLIIGVPFAMIAARTQGWRRTLLLGAVLLPLWTSLLVRTAAWFIILQDKGIVNQLLQALHVTQAPLGLLFERTGVVIAMTHVLLPFMVLPVYNVVKAIPVTLMPAAASLGANPPRAFLRVLLPLSMRGILSGAILVFMTSIGYYITPALIGGPRDQMISSIIAFYATGAANWPMAGALSIVLLAVTLALYAAFVRLSPKGLGA